MNAADDGTGCQLKVIKVPEETDDAQVQSGKSSSASNSVPELEIEQRPAQNTISACNYRNFDKTIRESSTIHVSTLSRDEEDIEADSQVDIIEEGKTQICSPEYSTNK